MHPFITKQAPSFQFKNLAQVAPLIQKPFIGPLQHTYQVPCSLVSKKHFYSFIYIFIPVCSSKRSIRHLTWSHETYSVGHTQFIQTSS